MSAIPAPSSLPLPGGRTGVLTLVTLTVETMQMRVNVHRVPAVAANENGVPL
jgi:hypothetical protein